MSQITFVQPDGKRRSVAVKPGATVMLTAVSNGIAGIIGECGGAAMCATCHVYLDEASIPFVPPVSDLETGMLESAAAEQRKNSRLGCQIVMAEGVNDLVVHIPSRQI